MRTAEKISKTLAQLVSYTPVRDDANESNVLRKHNNMYNY